MIQRVTFVTKSKWSDWAYSSFHNISYTKFERTHHRSLRARGVCGQPRGSIPPTANQNPRRRHNSMPHSMSCHIPGGRCGEDGHVKNCIQPYTAYYSIEPRHTAGPSRQRHLVFSHLSPSLQQSTFVDPDLSAGGMGEHACRHDSWRTQRSCASMFRSPCPCHLPSNDREHGLPPRCNLQTKITALHR